MERLTRRIGSSIEFVDGKGYAQLSYGESMRMLFERLAAYEDSGLSPERVAELAQAEAEGRLVVLPCAPGTALCMPVDWGGDAGENIGGIARGVLLDITWDECGSGPVPLAEVGKSVFVVTNRLNEDDSSNVVATNCNEVVKGREDQNETD